MRINVCVFERQHLCRKLFLGLFLTFCYQNFYVAEAENGASAGRNLSFGVIFFQVKTTDKCGRAEGQLIWICKCTCILIIHTSTIVLDRFVSYMQNKLSSST